MDSKAYSNYVLLLLIKNYDMTAIDSAKTLIKYADKVAEKFGDDPTTLSTPWKYKVINHMHEAGILSIDRYEGTMIIELSDKTRDFLEENITIEVKE